MKKRWLFFAVLIVALLCAFSLKAAEATVTWTIVPGDTSGPGLTDPAAGYTLYYGSDSAAVVDAAMADVTIEDSTFTIVDHLAVPGAVGDPVYYVVTDIQLGIDYWFTMKAYDQYGNRSILGNVVHHFIQDTNPPPPVTIIQIE